MELSGRKGIGLLIYALLREWMIEDLSLSIVLISADKNKIPRWSESTLEFFIQVREHYVSSSVFSISFQFYHISKNDKV